MEAVDIPPPQHVVAKEDGSIKYRAKDYAGAAEAYSRGLLDASASDTQRSLLLSNRAAAYLMLSRASEARADCEAALGLTNGDNALAVKILIRKSTALKQLGLLQAAVDSLLDSLTRDPASVVARDVDALRSAMSRIEAIAGLTNSYQRLLAVESVASDLGCWFRVTYIIKLKALIDLRRFEEAYNLSNILMRQGNSNDIEVLYSRARILYCRGDVDNCLKHLQQAMRSDPDNSEVRGMLRRVKDIEELKKSGDSLFRDGKYSEAIDKWSCCIKLDSGNGAIMSKVHCNRATAYFKLKQYEKAIFDCTQALEFDSGYVKALSKRAECYMAIGEPEKLQHAINDYETAGELIRDDDIAIKDIKKKLQQAKVALKRSKSKDLYATLSVSRGADDDEIKKAYKKAALKYHPDKQAGKSEDDQNISIAMFKSVNEAYEILSDPEKKSRYDQGVEVEDIDSACNGHEHNHHHHGGVDPEIIFQMFMQQERMRGGGGRF